MKLSEVLRERGYVHQFSAPTLEEITDGPLRTVYLGVDPTADSIHAGNFAQYMFLRRFAEAGHRIILLIGGGTALAGDPKPDVERTLVDSSIVEARAAKLKSQAERILGGVEVTLVNNADWLTKLNLMDFLRDTGKHFTVNNLIKKDAIATRLASEGGISYTEFTYPLLQGYDFWHLYKNENCDVQIGGSDQWGNIIAGVDLVRRKEGETVFALSSPLIIDKATGKKFGKSEGNAVWLDAEKTSPFQFYQFWLNASDESVEDYLKLFTALQMAAIADVMSQHSGDPAKRYAQRMLAKSVTEIVHGADEAAMAADISGVLFGDADLAALDPDTIKTMITSAPSVKVALDADVLDVLVESGLASSKREARQFVSDGAISLNGKAVTAEGMFEESDFIQNVALLRRGKRNVCILTLY